MTEENNVTAEEQARLQGWVPKDEFKGPVDNWRTADEFLELGSKMAPVQKERNNKLLKKVTDLERTIDAFRNDHMKAIHAAKQESYERAIADLKKQQREAVEEADTAKFDKVQEKIDKIKPPEETQPKPQPAPQNEAFIAWQAENTWYGDDQDKTQYADFIGSQIAKDYPDTARGRKEFLKAVSAGVDKIFGGNGKPQGGNDIDVEPSSHGSGRQSSRGKSYKDLPADVKVICDGFVAEGLFKDREDYAREYYKGA